MKTIKEIFGVEIGEKFDISDKEGYIYHNCYFDKNKELAVIIDGKMRNWFFEFYLLKELIIGNAKIIKKPEILNDKEKEFLSFIVNHFGRDKVKRIAKLLANEREYILIWFELEITDTAIFPYFPKGKMYKGMELNRHYTLEELKI